MGMKVKTIHRPRRVALLVETSNAYTRGILHGIREVIQTLSVPWIVTLVEHSRGEFHPEALRRWDGDGIIARIENPAIARFLQRFAIPVVDVSAMQLRPQLPCVETDTAAEARLAFEHLRGCGLRNFAFLGHPGYVWSKRRQDGFVACVRQAGSACPIYQLPSGPGGVVLWHMEYAKIVRWLKTLPTPVGIMTCYDLYGRQLLAACQQARILVPEAMAVIGVDNDDLYCDFASPPLSSVSPDTHGIGRLAAQLLERMMGGKPVAGGMHLVPPLGVVGRKSTDILAVEDRKIGAALAFIRNHACENIKIEDVLRTVPLSRRAFEARFVAAVQRSPHREIMRVRIERIQQLLLETDLPLARIAEQTGFKHTEYMNVFFKKNAGLTPGKFRAWHRVREPGA